MQVTISSISPYMLILILPISIVEHSYLVVKTMALLFCKFSLSLFTFKYVATSVSVRLSLSTYVEMCQHMQP